MLVTRKMPTQKKTNGIFRTFNKFLKLNKKNKTELKKMSKRNKQLPHRTRNSNGL